MGQLEKATDAWAPMHSILDPKGSITIPSGVFKTLQLVRDAAASTMLPVNVCTSTGAGLPVQNA